MKTEYVGPDILGTNCQMRDPVGVEHLCGGKETVEVFEKPPVQPWLDKRATMLERFGNWVYCEASKGRTVLVFAALVVVILIGFPVLEGLMDLYYTK